MTYVHDHQTNTEGVFHLSKNIIYLIYIVDWNETEIQRESDPLALFVR